mmetsp:Transcript_11267/g.45623  ORF Transcript_11267/g.45623 Transcript_11267/m.45623 type:complete len:81 (-) Transcript_11267:83-325(-)
MQRSVVSSFFCNVSAIETLCGVAVAQRGQCGAPAADSRCISFRSVLVDRLLLPSSSPAASTPRLVPDSSQVAPVFVGANP